MSDEDGPKLMLFPQCEVCWVEENSRWEADGVSEDGKLVARLASVAVPIELTTGEVNICCTCGEITVVGIFVEKYENEVKFNVDPLDVVPDDAT